MGLQLLTHGIQFEFTQPHTVAGLHVELEVLDVICIQDSYNAAGSQAPSLHSIHFTLRSLGSMGHSAGLSFDSCLTHIGQFNRYQLRLLLIASLCWVPNALVILLMVFHSSPNPIKEGWWFCNNAQDTACVQAYEERNVCGLPDATWSWAQQAQNTIIAKVCVSRSLPHSSALLHSPIASA